MIAVAAVAGAVAVTAFGVGDHEWKKRRLHRAEVAEWFCTHKGTRCSEADGDRVEAAWNRRERIEIALAAGLAVVGVAAALGRRAA